MLRRQPLSHLALEGSSRFTASPGPRRLVARTPSSQPSKVSEREPAAHLPLSPAR